MKVNKLGIVADDLTGAMDSSGYFADQDWKTIVVLDEVFSADADVLVFNTNSRSVSPEVAAEKVRQTVRRLHGRAIFKKIDSTLRGNITVELDAALAESGCAKAIVCPAFPVMGRTVIDGVLLVDGVPVAETQFAHDPVSPVTESHMPTLLRKSMIRLVGGVGVAEIQQGARSLYRRIIEMPQQIIVCDATTQSHLACIAGVADLAGGHWLLCGSSGLAREVRLTPKSTQDVKVIAKIGAPEGDVLVVVGSRNDRTAEQLLLAKERFDLPVWNLDVTSIDGEVIAETVAHIVAEVDALLGTGNGLVISAASSRYVPELKDVIPLVMAEATAGILGLRKFAGLFLTGGDIAGAVCRRLSVSAIQVQGEVESGIPVGELVGGPWHGMWVVTKAGGFGTPEALVKSITYLKKGRSA